MSDSASCVPQLWPCATPLLYHLLRNVIPRLHQQLQRPLNVLEISSGDQVFGLHICFFTCNQ
jgi:hypothetical protein